MLLSKKVLFVFLLTMSFSIMANMELERDMGPAFSRCWGTANGSTPGPGGWIFGAVANAGDIGGASLNLCEACAASPSGCNFNYPVTCMTVINDSWYYSDFHGCN